MPIESAIDDESRMVLSKATGHITLDDVREYFGEVWAGPQYQGYSEIIDWTDAERVDLTVAELRSLAGAAHTFYDSSSSARLAIVASGREGSRMARLYRTLREVRGEGGPEIRVFEDVPSARSWLGVR
jgi:hypothetical protein